MGETRGSELAQISHFLPSFPVSLIVQPSSHLLKYDEEQLVELGEAQWNEGSVNVDRGTELWTGESMDS